MVALSGRYSNPLDRLHHNRDTGDEPPEHRQRQAHRRLTEEQVDSLVEGYQSGSTIRDLVAEFGVHRTTVTGLLAKRGVETRVVKRRLTDDDVRLAASMYRSGESLATIGRRLGVCDSTVLREFRKAGIATRPRRGSSAGR